MSETKRNVPKLRFPGFTEDWEQRKLGDLAKVEMDKRIYKEQTSAEGEIPFYKIGTFGGKADSYISEDLYNEYTRKYPHPKEGDILISASGSIGRTVVYHGEKAYFQDSNIVWLNHNGALNNEFLLQFYSRVKWAGLEGSTIKRLYNKNILETEINVPDIREQKNIGEFFTQVDNLITLHQRKLENLKLKKKALLQKLFPKNGEQFPELRFPGFTDAWEQRKFSEITVNIGKRNKENLNLEPYAITKDDGFIPQAEAHDEFGYMKETDRKAYNIVKPNSFGYNPARINVGSIGYYSGSEDIIVSSLYEIFQTSENIYDRFLWHWFKSKQFQNWIERLQEGSVRLYFYYDKLCECEIFIPTVDEQIKIGNSLDRLDKLITLHQRKLEHLQLQKKALLQQMFV